MGKLDVISEAIGELRSTTDSHGKKLDEIVAELRRSNETQAENTSSLKEHMSQTKIIRADHEEFKKDIYDRLKPIESHVGNVQALARIAKWAVPLIGIPEAIYCSIQIIDWLKTHLH